MLNNGTHPGAMFVYGNTYGVFGDILNNPAAYGTYVILKIFAIIRFNRISIYMIDDLDL